MNIGIITEITAQSLNYGNTLQTFAISHFIENINSQYKTHIFVAPVNNQCWKKYSLFGRFLNAFDYVYNFLGKTKTKICSRNIPPKNSEQKPTLLRGSDILKKRAQAFHDFQIRNLNLINSLERWQDITNYPFDAFVVGSDVVWTQYKNYINRPKFLDFQTGKAFLKIAYAPSMMYFSFPKENRKLVKSCLLSFDYLSAREETTVHILREQLGITNIKHVVDPTLLHSSDEWRLFEKKPSLLSHLELDNKKYVFAYLLGNDASQKEHIAKWCKDNDHLLVTIPFASETYNSSDTTFGDIKLVDCSPQEWVWLIDNASYVITDSFHGVAFSIIFKRKFLALCREGLSIRTSDFLNTIGQNSKAIKSEDIDAIDNLIWDYESIYSKLRPWIDDSKEYLIGALAKY